jgi:steroid delta-isomerase-like uncharacterized protein
MQIPDVVRRYVDAFAARDSAGCARCFAPDGTYSDPTYAPEPLRPDAIRKQFGNVFDAFPDAATETVGLHLIAEQMVVWRWIIRGTNTGPYAGRPATGRQIELPGCEFIEVRDGLIQRVEGYLDRLTLLAQLGLAPAPARPSST